VLSGGRARLGVGASWYEREQRGLGVPVAPVTERFERLEETLQICLQMWSDDDRIDKTVLAVLPVLADVDGFVAAAREDAALSVTEIATMPDRHPVEFADQLGEKVLPRLAEVGGRP
jgi:alkanesulfonate monooxygenase SsuD/methylene tetrahydromethanopterin reductase-like flavin-dependent oxidoreductase (luciferase family)